MEPLTIFALTVGFIGAFHLLSTAVDRFGKGIYNRGNQQDKRDDWYCFFQLSDLLGVDQVESGNKAHRHSTITEAEQLEQRRQQQANRPRLRA